MSQAKSSRVIRNASEVVAHLRALKRDKGGDAWWEGALTFDWSSPRPSGNASTWVSVNYTDELGLKARLYVRIKNERHSKTIMPINQEDLAEMQIRPRGGKGAPEVRTMKPAVQILKWAAKVTTEGENSFTVVSTPGDEYLSAYYELAELVHEAFTAEVRARLDRGDTLTYEAKSVKTAPELLAKVGAKARGDIFLSGNQLATLQRQLAPAAVEAIKRCAQILSNVKVAPLVQTHILKGEFSGQPLPNPISRITIDVEGKTDKLKCELYDKTKQFTLKGKTSYEPAKVDGVPVTNSNIHKFLRPGSQVDGLVSMDSVCYSNMGISMPVKIEIAVVTPAPPKEATLDDVYGDEPAGPPATPALDEPAAAEKELKQPALEKSAEPEAKRAPARAPAGKAPAPAGKAAARAAPPAMSEDDLASLAAEMGVEE